ncbi:BCCT family transporter [Bacterioplanoides sp. SCSIO 12839]|uniref:BCCT family transporter n=1 Tax=Bacterioplanoides sp. SCSIO 12839 TaxID=2829569 RepID=UPI0021046598|nr:BCCT family transporter [Bacterioplanoides sp. SCSIO 12839]UTW47486.1 BCCT family transporter [Bacterioplanoides sp. SCSIO 12839]
MSSTTETELKIERAKSGFYQGFNNTVVLASKAIMTLIVIWAVFDPGSAADILGKVKSWSFSNLNYYYTWAVAFYMLVFIVLIAHPRWGKIKLGDADGKPEFSNFSWFSMMFGAGIGIGMLGYATGEPMYHMSDNPDIRMSATLVKEAFASANITLAEGADLWAEYSKQVAAGGIAAIDGLAIPRTESTIDAAYRYSFLHWGFSAWACYAIVGLALAFFSYTRGLPLTIRSTLVPLFGRKLEGPLGHFVDVTAVVATIFGISQTIGLGLTSFSSGLYNITGAEWLVTNGEPSTASLLLALAIVMFLSTLSALSGVGKGIKWLSNINMILSFSLLAFFLVFGATMIGFEILGEGLFSYVVSLPAMTFTVFPAEGPGSPGEWQGWWSIFYWAWWIAFGPFVGLFLARVSKNRSIREYVLGAIILPSLMCFLWFSLLGGTAINLELSGVAEGSIFAKSLTAQLYEVLNVLLSPGFATLMSALVIVLLLTYLVTTADSAVLVINTINAGGGAAQTNRLHIVIWGVILTTIIGALLLAGGLSAIQSAMIIGAIPFSFIMILMCISLLKAMIKDH